MGQLFDATRGELESCNVILNIALDEALSLCEQKQYERAAECSIIFVDLFDRLATRLRLVNRTIKEHGAHFGTLPNVTPLAHSNFRGATAQRISTVSALLSKIVFSGRTRFFHKLNSLDEITDALQRETRAVVAELDGRGPGFATRAWRELEVLGYDLNTCMGETTVVLRSFFCALPPDELETFRRILITLVPALRVAETGSTQAVEGE